MGESFQVDLSGMVDLLSRHLYSGPQVYLRELIQNGVDALAARRGLDPSAPETIRIEAGVDPDGVAFLEVRDTGVGLTLDEARELLSTIGRSSKRDSDFGTSRAEFVGQFGIGLLAAFMVADTIEVYSTSARPQAPRTEVRWTGHASGTFSVSEVAADGGPGTVVRLRARPGAEHWFDASTVAALASDYGALLPVDIRVAVPVSQGAPLWRRVTEPDLPWRAHHESATVRRAALDTWCERVFGFIPMAQIDLHQPALGLSGVAFVLPEAVAPGPAGHRVYVKRMLVGPRVADVLPDWAFFVRAAIDADILTPTASREQLHADSALIAARDALGHQLREWMIDVLARVSEPGRELLRVHHLALRAVARQDDDVLELVARTVPFETSNGNQTLADAAHDAGEVVFTTSTEAYRRVEAVARAHQLTVVNAGYVYDADLLTALGRRPGWRTRELGTEDLEQVFELPPTDRQVVLADLVAAARRVLAHRSTEVIVREFEPSTLPAMVLRDRDAERQRDRDRERGEQPGLWGGLLDVLSPGHSPPARTLVLNDRAAVVRSLFSAANEDVFAAGVESIYLSAVMLSGEALGPAEVSALNDSLGVLLCASRPDFRTPSVSDEQEPS